MSSAWDWAAMLSSRVTSLSPALVRASLMSWRAYSRADSSADSLRPGEGTDVGVAVGGVMNVSDEIEGVEVAFGEIVGVDVGVFVEVEVGGRVGMTLGV